LTVHPVTDVLTVTNLSMSFDQVTVLHGVSMQVRRGEIHALLGQNGSGKSTLIKVLSGFYTPDPGAAIEVMGSRLEAVGQGDPARLGIAFVHQDLGLVNSMSIVDNLAVGRYATKGPRIDWAAERARATQMLGEFGLSLDVGMEVGDVPSQAERALIAIARAVSSVRQQSGEGLLVLDEPTAYLPHNEVVRLQSAVRSLASMGIAVIYVTHKLDELPGFADRATVLRDGRVVGTVPIAETDSDQLVQLMIGHELEGDISVDQLQDGPDGGLQPVLVTDRLSGSVLRELSLSVRSGEVVGLTGLVGMGQEEVASLVFGAARLSGGSVAVTGIPMRDPSPRRSMERGVAFIPANRAARGVSLGQSLAENVSLPALHRYFRHGRLRRQEESSTVRRQLTEYQVTPPEPAQKIGTLSGGNQQKAVLAKWLQLSPTLVLVDEPTQGIDVGAREQVLERLAQLARDGSAVVMNSSEHDDLLALCHRVLVFRNGSVVAELRGSNVSKESLLRHSSYSGASVSA
jgi:ribose transport system ATP-binding protein